MTNLSLEAQNFLTDLYDWDEKIDLLFIKHALEDGSFLESIDLTQETIEELHFYISAKIKA